MKDLEDTAVYIEIDPSDVNYINRIIEGYEYLGILTTLDPKEPPAASTPQPTPETWS